MKFVLGLICILTVSCTHTKKNQLAVEPAISSFGLLDYSQPDYKTIKDKDESMELSAEVYDSCFNTRTQWSYKFYSLVYQSDGLNVRAIVGLPPNFSAQKKHPLVVFNRPGNRNTAMLSACSFKMLQSFAETVPNSVVVATQYRGSLGSEGKDEIGGADVNDVIYLARWAESTGFIEATQKYLIGWSRGGTMTYLTLKQHPGQFRAAAVIAGYTDFFAQEKQRKNMKKIFRETMPNYQTNRVQLLRERSVTYWPEKIVDPILVIHGTKDSRIPYRESEKIVAQLKKMGRKSQLSLFRGNDHSLNKNYSEALKHIKQWFAEQSHLNPPASSP